MGRLPLGKIRVVLVEGVLVGARGASFSGSRGIGAGLVGETESAGWAGRGDLHNLESRIGLRHGASQTLIARPRYGATTARAGRRCSQTWLIRKRFWEREGGRQRRRRSKERERMRERLSRELVVETRWTGRITRHLQVGLESEHLLRASRTRESITLVRTTCAGIGAGKVLLSSSLNNLAAEQHTYVLIVAAQC